MSENVVLFCRVSEQLKAQLEVRAKAERRSVASLVEVLLREAMHEPDTELLERAREAAGHVA